MKILMIIKKLHYSGAYKMFMWVAKTLADNGFDVTVFTYLPSDFTEFPSPKVKWIREDLASKGFFAQLKKAKSLVDELKPDISISFLLDANVINMLACRGKTTKSVVCERSDPFKPGYYKLKIMRPLFRLANGAVFQLPRVSEYYGMIKAPTAVIPNPVLCRSDIEVKSFSERDDIVVSLGRIEISQKRHDVLVKAFASFSKAHPEYKLVIYGDGPDEVAVRQMVDSLGLKEKVVFAGVTHNPQESIKNAKLYVLSSDYEGIPNSLIEAMSIGLPCIATDCRPGGAAFLIENNVSGVVVPAHDENALAQQMCCLADNPALADSLGKEAKKIVGKYSEKEITKKWIEYLKSLVE